MRGHRLPFLSEYSRPLTDVKLDPKRTFEPQTLQGPPIAQPIQEAKVVCP